MATDTAVMWCARCSAALPPLSSVVLSAHMCCRVSCSHVVTDARQWQGFQVQPVQQRQLLHHPTSHAASKPGSCCGAHNHVQAPVLQALLHGHPPPSSHPGAPGAHSGGISHTMLPSGCTTSLLLPGGGWSRCAVSLVIMLLPEAALLALLQERSRTAVLPGAGAVACACSRMAPGRFCC